MNTVQQNCYTEKNKREMKRNFIFTGTYRWYNGNVKTRKETLTCRDGLLRVIPSLSLSKL